MTLKILANFPLQFDHFFPRFLGKKQNKNGQKMAEKKWFLGHFFLNFNRSENSFWSIFSLNFMMFYFTRCILKETIF